MNTTGETSLDSDRRVPAAVRPAYSFVLFFLVLAAAACLSCTKKAEEEKTEKTVNVRTVTVARETVRPYIEAVGSLEPDKEVVVSSEVDGVIREILVDEGDRVSRGMVLARVSDTDYLLGVRAAEAVWKQARANLENARTVFSRMEALYQEKVVSKQEYDNAVTRLDVAGQDADRASAALSLSRERFAKTVIRSPMDGAVNTKTATAGDFIGAGRPLMRVISIDPAKLGFSVAEKDIGALKSGQEVVFVVDPYPSREFSGTLTTIYPSLDERSRTLKAEASVPNRTGELKPGIFARVRVYTGEPRQAITIPITSILYEGTKTRIFVAENDTARERVVSIGGKYGEMMEVLDGLQEKERLVVVGQNTLTDGVKIRVVE
ncbi:MAG TPA: efflux RND transporter periplasmic adaptor subunit [Deltaproteobacteria bacterium]|nr:efflux RND transporter periplasmic adaptor subunit [Deltaproteobacteria bacterium]OQC29423.1 MAG: Multidrug resistance protein MdtE precursor [Deltaproteobacteria bacterium ADurb.Bin072]HRW80431.1 efflux RND transporter periplasmic adaptor subunit [Desulfomonilia bacterium]NMD39648.1 efflux RND transporter periplasmic adaptor subunit [Deltaproteobacteria bacterium]HNQ84321.1 efflux RND transporter periplasmic adaptor subunit [Deltaproteobacteria bacterium]